jgi:hypothetical protein
MPHRIFTINDQIEFAALSGDHNPLHIDPVSARRTLFGAPVVHGIHSILWGLEIWLKENPADIYIKSIKAFFPRAIRVGERATLSFENNGNGAINFQINTGEAVCTLCKLQYDHGKLDEYFKCEIIDDDPAKCTPRLYTKENIHEAAGKIELILNSGRLAELFPMIARFIPLSQIATIISTTRLVGIECPGTNSIYSELHLTQTTDSKCSGIAYDIKKFDNRFGLAFINISSPSMEGTIKAFLRPTQFDQADFRTLSLNVQNDEFSDQTAVIIGGSRGLGEVTAKLLAAGGADVKLTYNQGEKDARRVVEEINKYRTGKADCFKFNVLDVDDKYINSKTLSDMKPTHLYYFATPFIFTGENGCFSPDLFYKFCDYYIKGFVATANVFLKYGVMKIYCPSSVAIDELPSDMGEYAAAKSAMEVLCSFLEKTKNIIIHRPRLPRMSTDQTVSLLPVKNHDPVPVLLEHLRNLRDDNG